MQYLYRSVVGHNSAAWLVGDHVRPLQVKSAPCPFTGRRMTSVVVRVAAVAINDSDVATQATGKLFHRRIKYPRVLGCDLAGEVVQVGERDFDGFRVGDRILGLALGGVASWTNWWAKTEETAFQEFASIRRNLACVIPDTTTYEQACVFPLTMTTAAYALFHEDHLYLCPPTVPPREPDASSDVVIITDGTSSVGCYAIQLAYSAGYWVYSTASLEYFETVKELGARRVFDCHTRGLADDILSAIREDNRIIAGVVAIGIGTVKTCRRVLSKYKGGNGLRENNRLITFIELLAMVKPPLGPLSVALSLSLTAIWKMSNDVCSSVAGVKIKPVTL